MRLRLQFIDEVRKGNDLRRRIEQRDVEVLCRHQFFDDLVNPAVKTTQISGHVNGFGNLEHGPLNRFATVAFGVIDNAAAHEPAAFAGQPDEPDFTRNEPSAAVPVHPFKHLRLSVQRFSDFFARGFGGELSAGLERRTDVRGSHRQNRLPAQAVQARRILIARHERT